MRVSLHGYLIVVNISCVLLRGPWEFVIVIPVMLDLVHSFLPQSFTKALIYLIATLIALRKTLGGI